MQRKNQLYFIIRKIIRKSIISHVYLDKIVHLSRNFYTKIAIAART